MPTAPINNIVNQQPNGPAPVDSPTDTQALVPFLRASSDVTQQGATQSLASGSWAASATQVYNVPSYGYLDEAWLTLTGTGGVNGTKTVAGSADAPWNLFSAVTIKDANGTPIWQLDGYGTYLARLLGGYKPYRPDQSTYGYSAIDSGASGTGNFKFKMEMPMDFGADKWGMLPNMDGSAIYTVNVTYNGPNTFYATSTGAPGTVPSIGGLIEGIYRSRPASPDSRGRPVQTAPNAAGTVQYWTSQTFSVVNGANTLQLNRVGNTIRTHILVFRDSSGTRSGADSGGVTPTSITFKKDAAILQQFNIDSQRQRNYECYGFDVPAGVVVFPYMTDPTGVAGHEFADSYLSTATSTNLQLLFTSTAAGTVTVYTNDIVIAGNMYPASAGL